MDVLAGVGDRRGHVAYSEKHNRGAWVEDAEVAMTRRRAARRMQKANTISPKPPAGFGLPVCPHEEKMRRCAPVRSEGEEKSSPDLGAGAGPCFHASWVST